MSRRLHLAGALAVPRNLPPDTRHRVVKSIRSHFMVDWITANWQPSVVVCRRHPLDVVASRMDMPLRARPGVAPEMRTEAERRYHIEIPPTDDRLVATAWAVGVQMSALSDARRANSEFHVVDHEELCRDPIATFGALASALGLDWTAESEAALAASNRPGTGYELNRVAADLPDAWRRRLSPHDARVAAAVIAQLPIASGYDLDVSRGS